MLGCTDTGVPVNVNVKKARGTRKGTTISVLGSLALFLGLKLSECCTDLPFFFKKSMHYQC